MRPAVSSEQTRPAVLVVQTSFLGDVVLTTPLLTALRRRIAPRRLAVLVRPEAVPLVHGHPDVDDVLVDDKRGADRGLAGLVRTARRLRREQFDVAVSAHRSLRTAIVLSSARIPRRIGFRESRGARLYHERVARDRRRHDVERNLALVAPFGPLPDFVPALHVPVAAEAAARAAALLPAGDGPLVGLAPGSVWRTKRWTAGGFAAVAARLAAEGARCVILGACARGVPVVAVFCATTPALGYGPYGARTMVVEADLACRPCARHGGPRCPRGTEDCARLVAPERVLAAARALLAEGRA